MLKVRGLQSEETRLRDRVQQLEGQVRHLQSALIEREKKDEHDIQLILKKSTELVAIQEKYQAIQETNAILQEQARKAVDEKERVQKDYLQVVYDLGKAQKQLNALSKQNVGSAQSDVLLREVDRLKHENEQLTVKLRDAERRQLEQQLMALQVEKEQFEAKLVKNEQTANKTMSARAEKAWLENKLRVISGDISKLKLSLR
ncbi:TPA: hypothetical protein N0F65_003856 [Lagenidium giganteum]|uniref:Uncharacterized protein n=1 Tax=Lagenidium giganteum TaxID=4803 RepID=A0AAV2ZA14_9STRA|nr:TPA: hypothetical protein N0F65_003856 [Lagenidium giganteum]